MKFSTVTAATSEPVTLAELKRQVRVINTDHDADLAYLGVAARELVEHDTERCFMQRTLRGYLDRFPTLGAVEVPVCPVTAITSIQYYDADGEQQTLSADVYHVDAVDTDRPARVILADLQQWPQTEDRRPSAVWFTMTAGYASAAAVPFTAKQAIRLLVGHWFENRESVLVGTVSKEIEHGYTALVNMLRWRGFAGIGQQ